MKKDAKKWILFIAFLYWSFACYDHFKHVGDHARNLMEWVGTAGEDATHVATGMIK